MATTKNRHPPGIEDMLQKSRQLFASKSTVTAALPLTSLGWWDLLPLITKSPAALQADLLLLGVKR